jgi:hypothetical protein
MAQHSACDRLAAGLAVEGVTSGLRRSPHAPPNTPASREATASSGPHVAKRTMLRLDSQEDERWVRRVVQRQCNTDTIAPSRSKTASDISTPPDGLRTPTTGRMGMDNGIADTDDTQKDPQQVALVDVINKRRMRRLQRSDSWPCDHTELTCCAMCAREVERLALQMFERCPQCGAPHAAGDR